MKKIFCCFLIVIVVMSCTPIKQGKNINEKIPEIAGTWFENGDSAYPRYIVQNKESLVFLSGNQTSTGNFKNSYEVFAKDWNANANISNNHQTLSWNNRKWIKSNFQYPNISGVWYENGEAAKRINITQSKTKLVMDNGSEKLNGYFYTTNAIYSLENNNYGTYSPLNNTISWGNKIWMRKVKVD